MYLCRVIVKCFFVGRGKLKININIFFEDCSHQGWISLCYSLAVIKGFGFFVGKFFVFFYYRWFYSDGEKYFFFCFHAGIIVINLCKVKKIMDKCCTLWHYVNMDEERKREKPLHMTPATVEMVELKLRNPSMTTREIGKVVGRSHTSVYRALKRYGISTGRVRDYKNNRSKILAGYQERILRSIDEESLEKASLKDKIVSMSILYDKEALEEGRATANVSFAGIVGLIEKEEKGGKSEE